MTDIQDISRRFGWPEEAIQTFLDYGACSNDLDEYTVVREFRNAYEGEYDSEKDFAKDFMEATGEINLIPETYRMYFDYEMYANDLFSGDFWCGKSSNHTIYVFRQI